MDALVHVFDPRGRHLRSLVDWTDVTRPVPFRGIASMQLGVPAGLEGASGLLRWGNIVVIESATGAELWGGVIRGPRTMNGPALRVTVESWEVLLTDIQLARAVVYEEGSTAGRIVEHAVGQALSQFDLPLELGEIWSGGSGMPREVRMENVYDVITTVADDSGSDWYISTQWSQGKDRPVGILHLLETAGDDKHDRILISEGINAVNPSVVENDADAVVSIVVIGGLDTWTDRPEARAELEEWARALHWPRTRVVLRPDLNSQDALQAVASSLLQAPTQEVNVGVTNTNAEWTHIRNGDMISLWIPSHGVVWRSERGWVPARGRVLERSLSESAGVQSLVVEVARETP